MTDDKITKRPLTDDERSQVEAHMGLVYKFCWRYRNDSRYEDLQSAAFIGLCYAVQRHNPSIATLSTFAWRMMHNEVKEEMCRLGMIRLAVKHHVKNTKPHYLPETIRAAERVKSAQKVDWANGEAAAVLAVDHGDKFRDYTELHEQLNALKLADRHCVIEMVVKGRTQEAVGHEMGVTKERARQLKLRGLHTLRQRLARLERAGAI